MSTRLAGRARRTSLAVGLAVAAVLSPTRGSAQATGSTSGSARLRVGVLDLSGSALRMQTATNTMVQPGGVSQQTTTTIAISPPAEFARGLTEMLTTVLVGTNRFVVLERAQLQAVQQEQDIGASGRVNKETAAAQGALIGAQALITGDISGFTYSAEALGGNLTNVVKGLNTSMTRVTALVTIDLRLVDAVTGEVFGAAKGRGKATATGILADLTKDDRRMSGSTSTTTPLGQASREALQDAVAQLLLKMPKVEWTRRVVDVRPAGIYLNAGAEDGIAVGAVFQVYEPSPPLIDPETGRNLGAPDRLVGEIEVTEVQPRFSVAKVLSGEGFQRNFVVRKKGS